MNFSFKYLVAIMLLVFPVLIFSQKGIIRGKVIDGENGEPLFMANAVVKGTQVGTTTDFDGNFEISITEGTYDLEITFIGMRGVTITGLKVSAGEVSVVDEVTLKPASNELAAVTITSEAIKNTEAAMVTVKRKSTNLIDGISASKLRKTGDSDAGDAVKRVTGVSVEGGKYVYVRGLGDRYTKTMLNGVDIPGLDPDRNSIQIDIFPTNLISNITVLKTGLAELPADFTGGVVDIQTTEFPVKKMFDVSVGLSYNPSMHFNSNYINYDGGATDFLGFDDGTRANPAPEGFGPLPFFNDDSEVAAFNQEFNSTLGAMKQTSLMDFGIGASLGDQIALDNGAKLGYIVSLTYDNSTKYYEEYENSEYQRSISPDETEMIYATIQKGSMGENNVLVGGLGGISYKTLANKYKFNVMHLQNGETRAAQMTIDNSDDAPGQSGYLAISDNLEYNERSLTNLLFSGEHYINGGEWQVNWKVSPTRSALEDPDIRKTPFTVTNNGFAFEPGQGGNPSRIWRNLEEYNVVSKVDIIKENEFFERPSKLKAGFSNAFKYRDYSILQYDLVDGGSSIELSGDPNEVLLDENIYDVGPFFYQGRLIEGVENPNEYQSNVFNNAAYVSGEFKPLVNLKATLGLRAEMFVQRHTGRDQVEAQNPGEGEVLNNAVVLDALDLFPSANFIYTVDEKQNLRASYFRSIARPSFKELSFAQILDPVSNRTFNGGLFEYSNWDGQLVSTRIHNIDLSWEFYMGAGELISLGVFYKSFDKPIELVRIPEAPNGSDFQPRNVGDGQLYGAEFQFSRSLSFISESLKNINLSGNFTYTISEIEMSEDEYNARLGGAKEGEIIENTRAMAGQAPYIVNAGFSYNNFEKGISSGLFYNVKGQTLQVVGGQAVPDVYTEPFHSLNFTLNKSFGRDNNQSVNLKVANILNDVRESLFQAYEATPQVFTSFTPGTSVSVSYTFSFE